MITQKLAARPSPVTVIVLGCMCTLVLGIAAYYFLPNPVDWTISYRPAALALISGTSPYSIGCYYNAPWLLLPLIPFALLPFRAGVAALFIANLALFLYLCRRLSARPLTMIAFMCSLPVVVAILFGQVDSMILLGLFLPPQIGLMLLLAKPQIGAAVALFWLVEIWRKSGWKQTLKTIAPVTVVFLLSFAIYGFWPLANSIHVLISAGFNTSLWPGSLMIGLPLIVFAIRTHREGFAWISAPFLSPYVAPQSWSVALLGLMQYDFEMVAACLASWALLIFHTLH